MDRLEMARKLFENPRLKAREVITGSIVECFTIFDKKYIHYLDTKSDLILFDDENDLWEIIEPKLK